MFLENTVNNNEKTGWIEVICGSMFSGKTEELIRRLRRAQFAKQKVEIFKPAFDTRYDDTNIVSHNANEIPSTPLQGQTFWSDAFFDGNCRICYQGTRRLYPHRQPCQL